MKIKNVIITGNPGTGKTTILSNVIQGVKNKTGIITNEILSEGRRLGFEVVTSTGLKTILAHINGTSIYNVSRYKIFPENLDRVIDLMPLIDPNHLLYIDEIGEMQLFSDRFKTLCLNYLGSSNKCLLTVSKVYPNEFIEIIKDRKDSIVIDLSLGDMQNKEIFIKKFLVDSND